jgi:hypothetical protein
MTLPTVDPLWRPNTTFPGVDDLALIRTYINWPASDGSLTELIQQLNAVAKNSPATVTQVQGWVDEIEELEETQADAVSDGTAHLGNAEEYEGPVPGTEPTRAQQLSQAGKLTWDTSLLKARYRFGSGARATAQGQRDERIGFLVSRIASALNVQPLPRVSAGSSGMLLRS